MGKVLNHEFQRQPNYYYCGPAATRVALSARNIIITQDELAKSLGTTTFGTDSSNNICTTLNQYLGSAIYNPTFIGGNDASAEQRDQLRVDVKSSIDAGFAVVTNVVGPVDPNDGGSYSYPTGHYVTVVGYDDNDNVLVADVNVREYWITVAKLATWIAGRGYSAAHVTVQPPVVVGPAEGTTYLIDLASYQYGIDLAAAKASGVRIVNIKTSQGNWYKASRAKEYADISRSLGLGVMSFHWLDNSASGAEQARIAFDLHQSIGAQAHQADVEDNSSWEITRDYVNEFQRLLGRKVLLYTGDWWWQARGWNGAQLTPYLMAAPNDGYPGVYPGDGSPLWNAGYGGWNQLSAMQFAVSPIPGSPGDVSRTMIKTAVWNELIGGGDMTPEEMLAARISGVKNGVMWNYSFQDFTVGTNDAAWTTLGELRAGFAADATRDAAQLAAINALSASGGVEAAPIIDAINKVRDEARVEYGKLHGELAKAEAEVAKLRQQLAAAAEAAADQLNPPQ